MHRFRSDRSGQNLVEFALVVVLLLLMVVGICEFGRAWNLYQVLANAAREGARLAALPTGFTNDAAVIARVNSYLSTANVKNNASVVIGGAGVDGGTGTQVSITVTVPYSFMYVGPVIRMINTGATAGADINITAQSVMRNE